MIVCVQLSALKVQIGSFWLMKVQIGWFGGTIPFRDGGCAITTTYLCPSALSAAWEIFSICKGSVWSAAWFGVCVVLFDASGARSAHADHIKDKDAKSRADGRRSKTKKL